MSLTTANGFVRICQCGLGGMLLLLWFSPAAWFDPAVSFSQNRSPNRRAAAERRWQDERAVGPFVLHADFSLEKHLHLLDELAQLHRDLTRTLALPPPREPIHLFLFREKATHRWYLKRYFPKAPYRRALYIKERGPGMVFAYLNREFEIDVRHESTHALLHSALPMAPLWLDEGLAEYFEAAPSRRAHQHPHMSSVKWKANWGVAPDLKELEGIRSLEEMKSEDYRGAWAWVHFMLHGGAATHGELVGYLGDIAAHTPPGLLSERLHRRMPDVDRRLTEHFRTWRKPPLSKR